MPKRGQGNHAESLPWVAVDVKVEFVLGLLTALGFSFFFQQETLHNHIATQRKSQVLSPSHTRL